VTRTVMAGFCTTVTRQKAGSRPDEGTTSAEAVTARWARAYCARSAHPTGRSAEAGGETTSAVAATIVVTPAAAQRRR
jgi:hypothetical protein